MGKAKRSFWSFMFVFAAVLLQATMAFAGEADIKLPDLSNVGFTIFGAAVSGLTILNSGLVVCLIGLFFGLMQYSQTKALPAHKQMLAVSNTIWETCKTYLTQQGKFLHAILDPNRPVHHLLLRRAGPDARRQRRSDPPRIRPGDLGSYGCMVRQQDQHHSQLQGRLRIAAGQPAQHRQHLPPLGHERGTPARER